MQQNVKRWALFIAIAGAVIALDQTVKWLVVNRLALGQSWVPVPALGNFLLITRTTNTGAAFGMFPMASNLFLLLAMVTIIVFIVLYPRLPRHAWLSRVSIPLVTGGALSNAIDRLRFQHVIDYVHLQLTPTFANISNFADHAITFGVILLLLDQWLVESRRKTDDAQPEQPAQAGPVAEPEASSARPDPSPGEGAR
jgi:signal peptidase II